MSTWATLYDFRDGYWFAKDGSGPYVISAAGVATLVTAPGALPTGGVYGYPGAYGTLPNGTPIEVSLANVSLPRTVFVSPTVGDTLLVEAYDGTTWTAWPPGTVGVFTESTLIPGTPVYTKVRFTRVTGTSTTSRYGIMADAAGVTFAAGPVFTVNGVAPDGSGNVVVAGGGAVTSVAGRTGAVVLAVADVSGAAPLASPTFTGTPLAPTATAGTNTTQVATTAFVTAAVAAGGAVTSVAGRTGVVVLAVADVSGAAPLASPTFTGTPLSTTAAANTNTTQIATTAFVFAERANAVTLTNKSISGSANTLSAIALTSLAGVATGTVIANITGGSAAPTAVTYSSLKTAMAFITADIAGSIFSISANTTLTNAHDGGTLVLTAAFNVTFPSGLRAGFGVTIMPPASGNLSIVSSGTQLNGGTTTLTRSGATPVSIFAVATDSYYVTDNTPAGDVTQTGTQTLTNKTLTAPTINAGLARGISNDLTSSPWTNNSPYIDASTEAIAPATGFTFSADSAPTGRTGGVLIIAGGTLASGTVNLPFTTVIDGQEFVIATGVIITSLTINPGSGRTLLGVTSPLLTGTFNPGAPVKLKYFATYSVWIVWK